MMPARRRLRQWASRAGKHRAASLAAAAAAVVLVAAAGLAAFGARAPARAPAALVSWRVDSGTTFQVAVDAARLDRFVEQRAIALGQERRRLAAIAAAGAERELAAIYGAMTAQVPLYTDWVYGWIDNYITTYFVIGRTFETVASPPEGVSRADVLGVFRDSMRSYIGERFARVVVDPADPQHSVPAAATRIETLLAAEWRAVLAEDREAWAAFLRREGRAVATRAAADAVATGEAAGERARCTAVLPDAEPPALGRAEPPALGRAERLDGEQADLFAVRLARPPTFFVFRVGIAPLFSTGSFIAITALTTPASALTLGATTASLWTLDFVLNQLDSLINRATFESRLVAAIDTLRRDDTAALAGRIDEALAAAFAALARCRDAQTTRA